MSHLPNVPADNEDIVVKVPDRPYQSFCEGFAGFRATNIKYGYIDKSGNQAIPDNLGHFLRWLALPRKVKHWSLTTLREKLVKIGAKVVSHSGYVIFQMAEVAVPRELFQAILERIGRLWLPPPLERKA